MPDSMRRIDYRRFDRIYVREIIEAHFPDRPFKEHVLGKLVDRIWKTIVLSNQTDVEEGELRKRIEAYIDQYRTPIKGAAEQVGGRTILNVLPPEDTALLLHAPASLQQQCCGRVRRLIRAAPEYITDVLITPQLIETNRAAILKIISEYDRYERRNTFTSEEEHILSQAYASFNTLVEIPLDDVRKELLRTGFLELTAATVESAMKTVESRIEQSKVTIDGRNQNQAAKYDEMERNDEEGE